MCVNFGDEILLRGGGGNVKPEKNGKTVISVENRKFSRTRMTKRTAPLNSSRGI